MARQSQTPGMIEEFEGAADRLAEWIREHSVVVGGLVVVVLGGAAAWGGYHAWSQGQEEAASNALDQIRGAYLRELGAPPGAFEEPQLANPEAARQIREEYLERFRAVAEEHSGTVAGTLALFEAADLLEKLGRPDQTEEVWQLALASASANPGLSGLLHQRIAETYEARESWTEAAEAHELAGQIGEYPLRYWALVDAARCWAAAGDGDRALALYRQVEREAPDLKLPSHLRSQRRELEALAAG